MPQLRRLNQLHERYGDKGLHVIGAFTQFQPFDDIQKHITEMGIKFPVAMDGFWNSELSARLLCHLFVIGVDGKLIHISINDWEKAALDELKKVKYPGLGAAEVHELLEPAAKAFGEQRFGEAYRLALNVAEGDHDFDVLDEADRIVERVRDRVALLEGRARLARVLGDYELALKCLHELESKFDGVDEFLEPAKLAAEVREIETFSAEAKARREFMALRVEIFRLVDVAGGNTRNLFRVVTESVIKLRRFVARHDRLAVSAYAKDLLEVYEVWASELEAQLTE
jgi:hypothetical protein